MNLSIDQIIDLIKTIVKSSAPKAFFEVIKPFLPAPLAAVLGWAVNHTDCLDELLDALRGAFGSTLGASDNLTEIAADIEATKRLANA